MISGEKLRTYAAELQRTSEMMSEVAQLRDAIQIAQAIKGHGQRATAKQQRSCSKEHELAAMSPTLNIALH